MEFKPVFLFIYIAGSVAGSLFILLWRMVDANLQAVPLYVVLDTIGYYLILVAPLCAGICGLITSRYFKYVISDEGIHAGNLAGASRFVHWDSIAELRPIQIGNLAFVRLVTEDGASPMWLPFFISDEQLFGGALLDCAPKNSAIRNLICTVQVAV